MNEVDLVMYIPNEERNYFNSDHIEPRVALKTSASEERLQITYEILASSTVGQLLEKEAGITSIFHVTISENLNASLCGLISLDSESREQARKSIPT
jgi:hypothetical protein